MTWGSAASRFAFAREGTIGSKAEAFGGTTGSGSVDPRFMGITNQAVEFPDLTREVKQFRSLGHGRKYFLNQEGRHEYGPTSISFLPTTGELLYYAFGQDDFTGGTPNTHILSPVKSVALPTMNIGGVLEGSPDFQRIAVGSACDGLQLSLSEGGELQASMDTSPLDVLGWDDATPSMFTQPTGADQVPYMFYDTQASVTLMGTYDYSTNTMSGGYDIAAVKGFSCGIRNNLKRHWYFRGGGGINAKKPAVQTTGYPDFDLSLTIVPSGKLSGDTDALYHLLENGTKGDILIPFYRSATDRLDLVFEDCLLKTAPHSYPEDGNAIEVQAQVAVEEFRAVVRDSIARYSTL